MIRKKQSDAKIHKYEYAAVQFMYTVNTTTIINKSNTPASYNLHDLIKHLWLIVFVHEWLNTFYTPQRL